MGMEYWCRIRVKSVDVTVVMANDDSKKEEDEKEDNRHPPHTCMWPPATFQPWICLWSRRPTTQWFGLEHFFASGFTD